MRLKGVTCGARTSTRGDGSRLMKKIEAVIRPFTVDDVKDALIALGVGGLTVTDVRGSGNESERIEHHPDAQYTTDLVPTGTPIGPDLSHIGAKHDRSYLIGWLRDPSSQKPTAHMPKLTLTDAEVQALVAYLASLR